MPVEQVCVGSPHAELKEWEGTRIRLLFNRNPILWSVIYNLPVTKGLDQELWKSCGSWHFRKLLNYLTNITFPL